MRLWHARTSRRANVVRVRAPEAFAHNFQVSCERTLSSSHTNLAAGYKSVYYFIFGRRSIQSTFLISAELWRRVIKLPVRGCFFMGRGIFDLLYVIIIMIIWLFEVCCRMGSEAFPINIGRNFQARKIFFLKISMMKYYLLTTYSV